MTPPEAYPRRRRRLTLALLAAIAVVAVGAGVAAAAPGVRRAPRAIAHAATAAPTATLSVPVISGKDTCPASVCPPSNTIAFLSSVNGSFSVPITVTATPGAGLTIGNGGVVLQYAPAGTTGWTNLGAVRFSGSGPYTAQLGYSDFGQVFPAIPPGNYDLRAAVTDSAGQTGYSTPVRNVVIDDDFNADTYLGMQNPGQALHGKVNLLAAPEASGIGNVPNTVQFLISPAGQNKPKPIGSAVPAETDGSGNPVYDSAGQPQYTATLDTTPLPDGAYDLSVAVPPGDPSGGSYVGNEITVVVDNTPPTVTLANPGASLSGVVPLSATAQSSAGVTSVKFQDAQSGSGAWSTIGLSTTAPYTANFDTRGLQNGVYDLRAVATDVAGNTATSVVSGVSITNSNAGASPGSFTVTDTSVPASGSRGAPITLLGEVGGSPDHETWAYGYTTAPPATVNGSPLPYTAAAGTPQLVLLRYTDTGGWQVADVLRDAGGGAFDVPAGAQVYGRMTASGEAWIVVTGNGISTSVFHRLPGGQFRFDSAASTALQPLLTNTMVGNPPQLRLGQLADGTVYGMLVNPAQSPQSTSVSGVTVTTRLSYGQLQNGAWTVHSVPTGQLPSSYQPAVSDALTLAAGSPSGPAAGWGALEVTSTNNAQPMMLGSFSTGGWQFVGGTGLDALDLSGSFAGSNTQVQPEGILWSASDGVWIKANLTNFGQIVALYDPGSSRVVQSWCAGAVIAQSAGCGQTLDANHPATLPDAVFDTPRGPEALALGTDFVDVYANGGWSSVAAPGFEGGTTGTALFTGPTDGWLAGANSVAQVSAQPPPSQLTEWPEANQATLVSAALPPAGAGIGTSGALAVGLDGTALHYDSSAGWLVDPVPARARSVNLLGVAYDGPSHAVAVGTLGTLLDWNGTSWSEDPQSVSVTEDQLNAVAFGTNGQGWAVGTFGTILHYDGSSWSPEQIDPLDSGVNLTSVAVAGGQVFAVARGNLITREPNGSWQRVASSLLPAGLPQGSLTLVSGLPDGGLVAAGHSVVLVRQSGSSSFQYSTQPIDGIAVALTAFRDPGSGQVRALVSVAPPANVPGIGATNVAGFPAGDGELLMQTANGWEDLSRSQYPISGAGNTLPGDGAPEPDPVLAIAASFDGSSAWAVGGYAGTQTASGLGTSQPLQARPFAWQTASIWRYDQGGTTPPPSLSPAQVSLPAQPNTVSFAFFSGAECVSQCSQVQDAQPDVNLQGAAGEIASFAGQPGGPAFAMLGGNAVGPTNLTAFNGGNGAADLADLHQYLSPLGSVPLYAAYGPLDAVPTASDHAQPWGDAFAQSPAPFGQGPAPSGITPVGSGGQDGPVSHYYSYDVAQSGGTLRVIVLDNSAGSLDASARGQSTWLDGQLAAARAAGVPVVVVTAQPLDSGLNGSSFQAGSASDADAVATKLAAAGVLAVFTTSPTQSDQEHMIPYQDPNAPPTGAPQIPEYEGAALGYQQTQNNGVLWYFVSVNTATSQLTVQGIPVVSSLALEPLDGLSAARSSTLSFRAVGRRPAGTLAATADQSNPQGFANYVAIPSSSCGGCVSPSYTFTSSNPAIGNFVVPSGPGSQFPKLSSTGKTTASPTSGLFCAFNAGETTVSVTSGLLTSSLTVTVQPGNIGQPCGTVKYAAGANVVTVPSKEKQSSSTSSPGNLNGTTPPATVQHINPSLPHIVPPPPAPVIVAPFVAPPAKPKPTPPPPVVPSPFVASVVPPLAVVAVPPVVLPPIPPPITPVPPGGATAPAQSTAKREEKARKHASQSAYVIRPAGATADDWFYPAVGGVGMLTILLIASGLRPGPKPKLVLLSSSETYDPRLRRRSRP